MKNLKQNFELLAQYNKSMNAKLYRVASILDKAKLEQDRGAYFGSILGTLNHILVGDTIWLKRFSAHQSQFPSLNYVRSLRAPESLSEIIYSNFAELREAREIMDGVIVDFALDATEEDYRANLSYTNTSGVSSSRNFGSLVQHLYNHQTHHRGQVTTLFNQLGLDCGVTDLLAYIPGE